MFSRVADRLHEAAAEGTPLGQSLEGVVDALKGDHAVLWTKGTGRDGTLMTARIDERDLHYLNASFAFRDNPLSPERLVGDALVTRSALMEDRDFLRTEYYNECIRPLGGFHALFSKESRGGETLMVGVCRPRRTKDFGSTEITTLRMLLPVLGTALELQRRLGASERHNAALTSVLDRLPTGVILIDRDAHPVFANARAVAIAAEGDGIGFDESGVFGATAAATQRVRGAIAEVAADGMAAVRRLRLERPSLRPALAVTVLPVARLHLGIAGTLAPHCALFINEPGAAIEVSELSKVYRLTSREGEVAALLAGGLDLKHVAERLGLGVSTVRSHLKRIFSKTGTHSQASLVAMLGNISRPF
jgi:DNA-binding CsgD family transcriptional regulator/PAS domain-containing protein